MDTRTPANTTATTTNENGTQDQQVEQSTQEGEKPPNVTSQPPQGILTPTSSTIAAALAVVARIHGDLQHVVNLLRSCHGTSCLKSLVYNFAQSLDTTPHIPSGVKSEVPSSTDEDDRLRSLSDQRVLAHFTGISSEALVLFADLVLAGQDPTQETKELIAHKIGVSWYVIDVLSQLCALRNLCTCHWDSLQQIWALLPDELTPSQQGTVLLDLRLLLGNLSGNQVTQLRQEVLTQAPERQLWCMQQLLRLHPKHCYLYQPIYRFLCLQMDAMLLVKNSLLLLTPVQMSQSIQLLRSESLRLEVNLMLGNFDTNTMTLQHLSNQSSADQITLLKAEQQITQNQIAEQLQVLEQLIQQPHSGDGQHLKPSSNSLQVVTSPSSSPLQNNDDRTATSSNGSTPNTSGRLSLRIVEYPSEKSVYRRNIRPHPSVVVNGDWSHYDLSQLVVAPVLVRCDQNIAEQKLTGNAPCPVEPSRLIVFRKLKILATSHQMGETLFVLRFELRQCYSPNEYRVLDTVCTRPIVVVSHSTQLKPALSTPPAICEVVPCTGPITGGTKVAILGKNFANSPMTKVRFDNIEVSPEFYGPSTLICTTPEHAPGMISVRVCNASPDWSSSAASFTYEAKKKSLLKPPGSSMLVTRAPLVTEYTRPDINTAKPTTAVAPPKEQSNYSVSGVPKSSCNAGPSFEPSSPTTDLGTLAESGEIPFSSPSFCKLPQVTCTDSDLALLEGGNNITTDPEKNTPLHWAMATGSVKVVNSLIEHGASLDAQNSFGETPLHYGAGCPSTVCGNLRCCEILLDAGADPTITSACGHTALHYAAAHGNVPVARLLLEHGVHPDLTDDEGETALHIATVENRRGIIRAILSAGGNPNCANADGETPLHVAVALGERSTADFLVSLGAVTTAVDLFGFTPYTQPRIVTLPNRQTGRSKTGKVPNSKASITMTTNSLVSPLSDSVVSVQEKATVTRRVDQPNTAILAM